MVRTRHQLRLRVHEARQRSRADVLLLMLLMSGWRAGLLAGLLAGWLAG